jgi:hypothetical protein
MRITISRRSLLGRGAAAMALAAGWTMGLARNERRTALGSTRWRLCAPLTGQVGVYNFHSTDNALDFFAATGTKVNLNVVNDSNVAGSGVVTSIQNSCSTASNPDQRRVQFNIRTNGGVVISAGVASHIKPTVSVGSVISGSNGQIGGLNGGVSVPNCYDPYHTHFGAPNMTGVGYWAGASVQQGFHAPWEKYV